jgi:hypothetical protein
MLCDRGAVVNGEFCELHAEAKQNLDAAFEKWRNAHDGRISKREFLERVIENDLTGEAAVEVANHLLGRLGDEKF